MARPLRIEMNGRGIEELLKSDDVREELTRRAEAVLATAKANAPRVTGEYRDSLHIVQDTTDRAAVRVAGGTDHDWAVEANTGNLARALDSA